MQAAARYVGEHRDELPDDMVPATATQQAVLAIRVHSAFPPHDDATGEPMVVTRSRTRDRPGHHRRPPPPRLTATASLAGQVGVAVTLTGASLLW